MNPQDPWQQPQQPAQAPQPPFTPPPAGNGMGGIPQAQQNPQPQQNQAFPGQPAGGYSQPQYTSDQYSIDYLNSIAPNQQKTVNRFAVFGLIGAVLMSVIVAVILIANSGGPSVNEQIPALQLRVNTLQEVTKAQQKNLIENQITEANASLTSALGSIDTNLQAIMKERKLKKVSEKSSVQEKKADALAKTLSDAYQRGTLDRTYTTNMVYELTLLRSQFAKFRKSTSNKELRELADSSLMSIDVTLKSYAAFNATK